MDESSKSIIVITSNQVSLNLIYGLREMNYWESKVAVFYHEERSDLLEIGAPNKNFLFIKYTKLNFFKVLMSQLIKGLSIQAFVPHLKLGKFVTFALQTLSSSINYIDDGLDTFRNTPNNINPAFLRGDFEYITFKYEIPFGEWLKEVRVKKIVDLKWLYKSSRPKKELNHFSAVLVEAPDVNKVFEKKEISVNNILAVRHTNPLKRDTQYCYKNELNGIEIALEESLKNYEGHLITGATMVLISVFINKIKPSKITIVFSEENIQNHQPILNIAHSLDTDVEIVEI